jgi:hypothetical protein
MSKVRKVISMPPRDAIQIHEYFGGKEVWGWYRVDRNGIVVITHKSSLRSEKESRRGGGASK